MANLNENVDMLIADSRFAFMQGKYKEALSLAKNAIELDNKNADAFQCAGNAYMSTADYSAAIDAYKKAVECEPDKGDRYFNLAYAYATDNKAADALAMFAKADEVGCSPNVVGQLYKIVAMLCFDMRKFDDAIINFIKAEKIIGIDMDILQRKALSYSMSGQTSAGIEVANQMKVVAPTEYLGYRIAFNILLQEDRLEEAEKELDRAERFAKPTADIFADWVAYQNARFKLDGDPKHLLDAVRKINDSLCVLQPSAEDAAAAYLNAAEIYVQLENADMALNCLHAAENPAVSYNEGFSVIERSDIDVRTASRPSEREIAHAIDAVRRKYGDRRLEAMGREMTRKTVRSSSGAEEQLTPLAAEPESPADTYRIDDDAKVVFDQEKQDQLFRLYLSAYTLKKDIPHIKTYASKLANSTEQHNKYVGKYSLVKALKDEGDPNYKDEYQSLLRFLRNSMIKDPSDLMAVSFRIQCLIDLGQFDDAEKLCGMLSDELAKPLREQIISAKAGGDS